MALIGLEVLARVAERLLPPAEVMRDVSEARVFEADPSAPGWVHTAPDLRLRADRATWVYPDQRFTVRKPEGTVRVAVVGGSNVYRLQAYAPRLAAGVAAALGDGRTVEVINGGGNAQGSRGVLHVGRELLAFDLDALVLYTGHNEYAEARVTRMLAPGVLTHVALARVVTRAWSRALRGRREEATARELEAVAEAAPGPATRAPERQVLAPPDAPEPLGLLPAAMADYRDHLSELLDAAAAAGVPVVVATVPSNLRHPLFLDPDAAPIAAIEEAYALQRWEAGRALVEQALAATERRLQSSPLENRVLRVLAAERGLLLADVEAEVAAAEPHGVPGETLFVDRCHFTPEGFALWVDVVAPVVAGAIRAP